MQVLEDCQNAGAPQAGMLQWCLQGSAHTAVLECMDDLAATVAGGKPERSDN